MSLLLHLTGYLDLVSGKMANILSGKFCSPVIHVPLRAHGQGISIHESYLVLSHAYGDTRVYIYAIICGHIGHL